MSTVNDYRFIRVKEVVELLGISKSSIYEKVNPKSPRYDVSFPRRFKIGAMTVGWLKSDIIDWLKDQKEKNLVK